MDIVRLCIVQTELHLSCVEVPTPSVAVFGDRPSIERGDVLIIFDWHLHKKRTDTSAEAYSGNPQGILQWLLSANGGEKLHRNQRQNHNEANFSCLSYQWHFIMEAGAEIKTHNGGLHLQMG